MFKLTMLLDISEGNPGMLVPVFSSPSTNMPYVQQMDEFLLIKEMVPFLDYEHYRISHPSKERTSTVGEKGIIAFRAPDNEIICGDFEDILAYISAHRDLIECNLLLRMQLHRIESAGLIPSYELWRSVASQVFRDPSQATFWVNSEHLLFQKQQTIWADIDPLEEDEEKSGAGFTHTVLTERGSEYLIRWLSERSNYPSKNWTKVWHHVHEKLPFDERVSQTALSWIYALDAEDREFLQARTIIFALLQGWSTLGKDYPDYGEFLSDRLATDPSLLFSFLRPQELFTKLFQYLGAKGNTDDVLKLADFSISELPKEQYIGRAIASALSGIVNQTQCDEDNLVPSTRSREFEQSHILEAAKLLQQMKSPGTFDVSNA